MARYQDGERAWRLVPLYLLAPATVIALADPSVPLPDRAVTLGVSVLVALWHWWMMLAHPDWPERALLPMAGYFAGLLALTWVLSSRHLAYALLVFACFPAAFVALPGRYAYVGVAATALVAVGGPYALLNAESPWQGVQVFVGAVVAAFVGWSIRVLEAEVKRRQAANRALEGANARLARLGEENAELQGRLLAAARRTGVAGERGRLAREIHDTMAQGLAGIVTQLEAAEEVANDADAVRRRLAVARGLARESLTEVRRSLDGLRPGPLAETRLPEALSELVSRWSATHELPATLTVTGTARLLHPEVEVTLYRAVQEALANVARHAEADKTGVTLSYMEDVVVADIRDDGKGFDPAELEGGGFGLTAMRQRVVRLAGNAEVESAPGQGTAVSVTIPAIPAIPADAEREAP
ncbi:sensor histidine kinase [Spongiactinospora sp. TRM90649]|uniref:sensor histidine kinase n=1 Tax=Spongiactinospora sp. TRM90649 TaxID=3031114 RepID=UPI0023F66E42|nr:sensor histidine kinase [Spongiactinospora sp. TRM90649]MDF5753071.1 sensor histidine kinase [Spongiactinospora sp. TRM90649]